MIGIEINKSRKQIDREERLRIREERLRISKEIKVNKSRMIKYPKNKRSRSISSSEYKKKRIRGFNPNKTGTLYILKSYNNNMKIGISNNPTIRHKLLKSNTPFEFDIHYQYTNNNGKLISMLEKRLHSIYSSKRAFLYESFDGYTEWFIYDDNIIKLVEKLAMNMEECY